MSTCHEAGNPLPDCAGSVEQESPVLYGELVLLGYNGVLPDGNRGRRRSKYQVHQQNSANGVKYSKHYDVEVASNPKQNQTVVEYELDEGYDMFQIGRSSERANQFVVIEQARRECTSVREVFQSSVSRFACRVLASRSNPKVVRVYAGGFDSSRKLFLGQSAIKLQKKCDSKCVDGLTTNGVLLCHPRGSFSGGEAKAGLWHEVSLCGEILSLRDARSAHQPGEILEDETNVLQDGSLIDLCGVTLLWRSADALRASPTSHTLEALVDDLNAGRPQCPVGLNTLVLPRTLSSVGGEDGRHAPYVYLKCGHVQGLHAWGRERGAAGRRCPMCREVSTAVKLCLGSEPAFYVDVGKLTHAFNPCGHLATEKTVKYWSSVPVPRGGNGFEVMCPFCGALLSGSPGYIRLIFQDNLD
ncbi:hypothetical protein R5R35_002264 [Gryllus longicercus]|uniref:Protein pellino n=1 Tax=Gryllus longicercus TaxID=2509291 RepID=A0AAN9Z9N4_9ORTH